MNCEIIRNNEFLGYLITDPSRNKYGYIVFNDITGKAIHSVNPDMGKETALKKLSEFMENPKGEEVGDGV